MHNIQCSIQPFQTITFELIKDEAYQTIVHTKTSKCKPLQN